MEGLGFGEEVLLEGGEVGGEVLPEEGAGGEEGGLLLHVFEGRLDRIFWRVDRGWGGAHGRIFFFFFFGGAGEKMRCESGRRRVESEPPSPRKRGKGRKGRGARWDGRG